jgi:WSC domain-containing protein/uncharacterized protein DUF1996
MGLNATNVTMLNSECTTCEITADKSGYWTPLLFYETVTGLLAKLPGCIQITEGPGNAPAGSMACPSGVRQAAIIPTANSVAVERASPDPGQPFGLPGYIYMGCSSDDQNGRVLQGPSFSNATGITVEACQQYCSNNGQKYAGVEFGQR